jgi:hypothetical protein
VFWKLISKLGDSLALFILQSLFASLTDYAAHIHVQYITDPKQRIESRVPWSRLNTTDEGLAQPRFFGERIAGDPLPLPLLHQESDNLSTDFVSKAFF